MKRNMLLIIVLLLVAQLLPAQDVQYAQSIIDTLAGPYFHGRGYVKEGDQKAARFIRNEMNRIGLQSINGHQSHQFTMSVNTFPGSMSVRVYGEDLIPGIDFVVDPACPSVKLEDVRLFHIGENQLIQDKLYKKITKKNYGKVVVVLDTVGSDPKANSRRDEFVKKFKGLCLIDIRKDLTWSVSRIQEASPVIWMMPGIIQNAPFISVDIEAKFEQNYTTTNVLGMVQGTEVPDSFIVITGHYDHLGGMGSEVYIPGANDNASGIAMILDLATYYQAHPCRYSILFIAFAAEEAGLVGSYHFVQEMSDYLNKNQIRFLINMDLMGSGEDGMMAVNGSVFTEEFSLLQNLNSDNGLLKIIKSRGKAANSDHYFFTEAGVRGYFFYQMGAYAFYHEIDDKPENLRLQQEPYTNTVKLIQLFVEKLTHSG